MATPAKFEIIQQPNTILEQQGSVSIPTVNPDHKLFRISAATTWATVFVSVTDVHDQAKAFTDSKFRVPIKNMICSDAENAAEEAIAPLKVLYSGILIDGAISPDPDKTHPNMERIILPKLSKAATPYANCIMRVGPANRAKRFFAGFKTQFNYGQNPQIQQGFDTSGTPSATSNLSLSGEIDFDPKGLFMNGSDWNNAYEAAKAYDNQPDDTYVAGGAMNALRERAIKKCPALAITDKTITRYDITADCLRRIAGMTTGKRIAAFLIPQFSEAIKNQFDYVKQGGLLVAAPFPTKSLSDATVTFDISHLIPSAKQREDSLKMLLAMRKDQLKKVPVASSSTPERDVLTLYVDFASQPEKIDDDEWYEAFRAALSRVLILRSESPRVLAASL